MLKEGEKKKLLADELNMSENTSVNVKEECGYIINESLSKTNR